MEFVDPLLFREFCDENQSRLRDGMKSYPLDYSNFEKWVNHHREGTIARNVAERFRAASRHVSHYEFFGKYDAICEEIKGYLADPENPPYEQILFYVNTDDNLKKSNFWLALYMFPRIFPQLPPPGTLFISTHFEILAALTLNKKTLIIVPDDASYSGAQMVENLEKISNLNLDFRHMDILIAVGYISNEARDRINLKFPNSNIIICDVVEYFHIFQIGRDEARELADDSELYTLYFDHKLPDTISIYQLQYALGIGFGTAKDFKYVPMSLIDGCNNHKGLSLAEKYLFNFRRKTIMDLQSIIENMCPFPPYKKIAYTFKRKVVNNIQMLMRGVFNIDYIYKDKYNILVDE